jgi:hypothetical protein
LSVRFERRPLTVIRACSDKSSQIWFRDLRGKWSFLAQTFTHYYRMMIAHLGLVAWPCIFSDGGLDSVRKPWFYLFIPQRMALDEQEESRTAQKATGSAPVPICE